MPLFRAQGVVQGWLHLCGYYIHVTPTINHNFVRLILHFAYVWKMLMYFHVSSDVGTKSMQCTTLNPMACSSISSFFMVLIKKGNFFVTTWGQKV